MAAIESCCAHLANGWCPDCVSELHDRGEALLAACKSLYALAAAPSLFTEDDPMGKMKSRGQILEEAKALIARAEQE